MIGLQRPAYRSQIVAAHTLARQQAQRNWTGLDCATLLRTQPSDLMGLIHARMEGSAENAANHRRRNGGSSTGGPRGHMECRGYGPCLVSGVEGGAQAVDMLYEASKCEAVSAVEVLRRTCGGMEIDERLYRTARKRLRPSSARASPRARRAAGGGRDLAARADAQRRGRSAG